MNERIKQLMLQAGGVLAPAYVTDANDNSVWTDDAKVDTIDMDAEYFARLLVRETMNVTKDYTCNQGLDYSAPVALARHFGITGVEE